MKVTIEYKYIAGNSFPFVAYTKLNGEYINRCDANFAAARERLLAVLKETPPIVPIPEPEEIEI